jgi:hypothetical protein
VPPVECANDAAVERVAREIGSYACESSAGTGATHRAWCKAFEAGDLE